MLHWDGSNIGMVPIAQYSNRRVAHYSSISHMGVKTSSAISCLFTLVSHQLTAIYSYDLLYLIYQDNFVLPQFTQDPILNWTGTTTCNFLSFPIYIKTKYVCVPMRLNHNDRNKSIALYVFFMHWLICQNFIKPIFALLFNVDARA